MSLRIYFITFIQRTNIMPHIINKQRQTRYSYISFFYGIYIQTIFMLTLNKLKVKTNFHREGKEQI